MKRFASAFVFMFAIMPAAGWAQQGAATLNASQLEGQHLFVQNTIEFARCSRKSRADTLKVGRVCKSLLSNLFEKKSPSCRGKRTSVSVVKGVKVIQGHRNSGKDSA